jgi:hypothetical protein
MPKSIRGRKLTAHEHEIWKAAYAASGKGTVATAAVKKSMAKRSRKK